MKVYCEVSRICLAQYASVIFCSRTFSPGLVLGLGHLEALPIIQGDVDPQTGRERTGWGPPDTTDLWLFLLGRDLSHLGEFSSPILLPEVKGLGRLLEKPTAECLPLPGIVPRCLA